MVAAAVRLRCFVIYTYIYVDNFDTARIFGRVRSASSWQLIPTMVWRIAELCVLLDKARSGRPWALRGSGRRAGHCQVRCLTVKREDSNSFQG